MSRKRTAAETYMDATPEPTEEQEQRTLCQWARMQECRWPELALMYHIPNGGSRQRIEAAKLKGLGVKSGVPDICLPVPRGGQHGLYIELKRRKSGRVSPEQLQWLEALAAQGYTAAVCCGCDQAIAMIGRYLRGEGNGNAAKIR